MNSFAIVDFPQKNKKKPKQQQQQTPHRFRPRRR